MSLNKALLRKAASYVIPVLLLLLLLNPTAKAWLLRQFMSVGIFNASIRKEAVGKLPTMDLTGVSFQDGKGKIISGADLKGKVVFINFWATWCPPCIAEMPALDDLYNQFKNDERLVFLFVNEDNDTAKAFRFMETKNYDMPVITSVGNIPSEIYSGTLPTTVILNKKGEMVYHHEGIARYNTAKFASQLKALL